MPRRLMDCAKALPALLVEEDPTHMNDWVEPPTFCK